MIVIYLLLSVALIIIISAKLKVHPFVALLLVAILYGIVAGMPLDQIITSVNSGFGNTMGGIGMIIILGVIIGAFLENSGGAYTLAEKVLKFTGKKKIPLAMGLIGWFVSIPEIGRASCREGVWNSVVDGSVAGKRMSSD